MINSKLQKKKNKRGKLHDLVHAFNPRSLKIEACISASELNASLIPTITSRTVRNTYYVPVYHEKSIKQT